MNRITFGILLFLCAAGTAYSVLLDGRKLEKQNYRLQDKPALKANGHVNNGFTSGKTAGVQTGGHVNGGFTIEKTADIRDGGHVNSGLTNGNVGNDTGGTIVSYPNSTDVANLTATEMIEAEGGMANGQNGSAGEKTVNGTANGGRVSAPVQRSDEESELDLETLLYFLL